MSVIDPQPCAAPEELEVKVLAHLASPVGSVGTGGAAIPLSVDNDPLGLVVGNKIVFAEDALYDVSVVTYWSSSTNSKVVWTYKNTVPLDVVAVGASTTAHLVRNDVPFQAGDELTFGVSTVSGSGSTLSTCFISVRRSGDPFG